MPAAERAGYRDIVQVVEDDHRHHGRRFIVISGCAGIGGRYIHACAENNHLDRTGLTHEQVDIVGQVPFGVNVPVI